MGAQVPDVVTRGSDSRGDNKEGKEVVQLSQILPGYAPSYANDYVPPLVNDHSFSTFANTISFNVSRYPTLSEVTDSKKYTDKRKEEKERTGKGSDTKSKDGGAHVCNSPTKPTQTTLEYVPAEYFRGVNSDQINSVSRSVQSVGYVRPDVLASGRLLNCMTPVPVPSLLTPTTTVREQGPTNQEHQTNGFGGDVQ